MGWRSERNDRKFVKNKSVEERKMTAKVKVRTLDAICAKLKSINGEENSENVPEKKALQEENDTHDSIEKVKDNLETLRNNVIHEAKTLKEIEKDNNGSSSRRKSRKAAVPRNIAQVREILDKFDCVDDNDELAEYEINNQNTDFPPEVDEDTSLEKDLSYSEKEDSSKCLDDEVEDDSSPVSFSINSSLHNNRKQSRKPRKSRQSFNNTSTTTPLDLSITKLAEDSSKTEEDQSSQSLIHSNDNGSASSNLDSSISPSKPASSKFKVTEKTEKQEMTVLKDYAESTMNELLSMYGFSGGSADSVMQHIQSNNFTSDQILHEQSPLDVPNVENSTSIPPHISPATICNKQVSKSLHMLTSAEKKGIYTNYVNPSTSKSNQSTKSTKSPNVEVMKDDKFTNSAAYIKAVFNNQSPDGSPSPIKHPGLPDYSKYLKRFSSGSECKIKYCKELGYREHFHCMDCNFRVFVKKEEMVRHYKWHRKREESLQHGFMRYSPMDDCCQKYGSCTHNGRQTHYHCLQPSCDKVYISTSDVQMHANYHRKDSAIIQEGFQRFRATEDCGTPMCAFYGQRTTHFHCRRPGCNFTFKNKADMEKHKTYHQKDEVLGRDGFKKFMKYEHCGYIGCRYSKLSNHIHCIRPGCIYVLHSTAQLFSHKRKHERRDFETAYRKFREDSNDMDSSLQYGGNLVGGGQSCASSSPLSHMSLPISIKTEITEDDFKEESCDSKVPLSEQSLEDSNSDVKSLKSDCSDSREMSKLEEEPITLSKHAEKLSGEKLNDSLTLPIPGYTSMDDSTVPGAASLSIQSKSEASAAPGVNVSSSKVSLPHAIPPLLLSKPSFNTQERKERDESWKNYLIRYTANDPCNSRCQYLYKDHYHCRVEGCLVLFKSKDGVREHARFHELQDRITPVAYTMYTDTETCPESCQYSGKQRHYHCIWSGCTHVVPHEGPTFGRLEHYRIHEYARSSAGKTYKSSPKSAEDTPRKRGRPPKYPRNTIPVIPKVELTEFEMQNSFGEDPTFINGFKKFEEDNPCPDELCLYRMKEHYHCARPRCYQATDRLDVLNLHAKDFHSFVTIHEGFEFFDRNVNCRRPHCHNNKANRHFHCVRPKCDYSFVRHSTMLQHNKKHEQTETPSISKEEPQPAHPDSVSTAGFIPIAPADPKAVIKTSGTFYPLSSISSGQSTVQISSVANLDSTIFHPMAVSGAMTAVPMVSSALTSTMINAAPGLIASTGHPLPLAVLLQQGGNSIPQPSWPDLKNKMHYGLDQNCGRPFCKLKKKDHYHCFECNQAFSDMNRVKTHVAKHGLKFGKNDAQPVAGKAAFPITIAPKPDQTQTIPNQEHHSSDIKRGPAPQNSDDEQNSLEGELNASDSLNLNPSTFSNLIAKAQKAHCTSDLQNNNWDQDDDMDGKLVISETETCNNVEEEAMDESSFEASTEDSNLSENVTSISKRSGRKRMRTKHNDFVDSGEIVVKQRRISSSSLSTKSSKDDSIPDGYIRVRHKDDCQFVKCAYRQGITHFHCTRPDCGYSFSDRSRLIQHTLRHERIDSLTGGEMQQFRMNQPCGREACEYEGKASHFHCLKCNYNCTDSSKVLTHRKYHAKLDNINSQGFQKFGVSEKCEVSRCPYELKQTHYHCMKTGCNYAVLGPAQIASHNIKHANDSL